MKAITATTLLISLLFVSSISHVAAAAATSPPQQQQQQQQAVSVRGFSAVPDPDSPSPFQPLLTDPSAIFSFGFLKAPDDSAYLDLAVLHLPSSLPLWRATPVPSARPRWAASTLLSFNGTLILSDTQSGVVLWSTPAAAAGDRLVLLNSSNLVIESSQPNSPPLLLWQSFDYPSDTLVQSQNLTGSNPLSSTNHRYTMRLGANYLALYMEFVGRSAMYWKHTAMEAKAQIVAGGGPVYARLDGLGFIGMYQKEEEEAAPVDVVPFDTFNRGVPSVLLHRLTLEADGNLRAYYWNAAAWILDYTAITDRCGLPATCGAYGICRSEGSQCGCLTDDCSVDKGDDAADKLCIGGGDYGVIRRKGVDLANKELLGFEKVGSVEECERSCERNCTCWGAVYNNATGSCYRMEYPVQTVLGVGDDRKLGYFKLKEETRADSEEGGEMGIGRAVVVVVGVVGLVAAAGFGVYKVWDMRRRRRRGIGGEFDGSMVEGLSYKDLSTNSSFRSIELSNSFRK